MAPRNGGAARRHQSGALLGFAFTEAFSTEAFMG